MLARTHPVQTDRPRSLSAPGSIWTDERVSELCQFWDDGYSASAIADKLGNGISRCAVLGKAHRLELTSRENRKGKSKLKAPSLKIVLHPKCRKAPRPFDAAELPFSPVNLSLLDLGANQCRFPTTDDNPFLFCGMKKKDGSVYCPHHHQVTHLPPEIEE